MVKISIVITTHKRETLLTRTLKSIFRCTVPECPVNLFVIENGFKGGAEEICKKIDSVIPIQYCYLEKPGTSNARAHSLSLINNDTFVIFFDDDVKVEKNILLAYYEAFKEFGKGYFYGGSILPDYESEPQINYLELFPFSITGFRPFPKREITKKPMFLGANWAACASDIIASGNFNVNLGPGGSIQSTGHEADIQKRLLEQGCSGVYLPDALVWHYVPKSDVCFEWLKNRYFKNGLKAGYTFKETEREGYILGIPRWLYRKIVQDFLLVLFQSLQIKRGFAYYEKKARFYRTLGIISFFLKNRHRYP
ncbi:MAG TPA: hypothetical protein DCR95_02510 [Desulfobacter sp.]|nr:hypothetical protein [Desulfobacter sp.]